MGAEIWKVGFQSKMVSYGNKSQILGTHSIQPFDSQKEPQCRELEAYSRTVLTKKVSYSDLPCRGPLISQCDLEDEDAISDPHLIGTSIS